MNKAQHFAQLIVLSTLLLVTWLPGTLNAMDDVDPPIFIDNPPADTTINCVSELPAPVSLTATDDNDPGFPMEITPVDSPDPGSIPACAGGVITRTWTATDLDGMSVSVSQTITIAADTEGPLSIPVYSPHDTIACDSADYALWINSKRLSVASSLTDCQGSLTLNDDAPADFDVSCNTLFVTFMASDPCGNNTNIVVSYTVIDTIAPVVQNMPNDTTIVCDAPVPPPPTLTATDNCNSDPMVTFNEGNDQTSDGSCSDYNYTITRTWIATDSCGNAESYAQSITIVDNVKPTFTLPPDASISCDQDADDLSLTGTVSSATDNCDPNPTINYTDFIEPGSCNQNYTILRTWRATDVCGNIEADIQTISVTDNTPPDFAVPADITISCEQVNDLSIAGAPSNITDNCDTTFTMMPEDLVITGSCPNTYTIRRTWRVADDCGNTTEKEQLINVVDDVAPTFSQAAQDLEVSCDTSINYQQSFQDWIDNHGEAIATDNCSPDSLLSWTAFNAGTNASPSLPAPAACPAPGGVVLEQAIDFVVEDECGQRDTTTAIFRVVDDGPPVLSQCPADTVISTSTGLCTGDFTFLPPLIEDGCFFSSVTENINQSAAITGPAIDPGEFPADPIDLVFAISTPLPINASGPASLQLDLINADAEEASEYFLVYGEDGSLLGRTGQSPAQCTDSDTTLTISAAQINAWAIDGSISIRLEAFEPPGQPGRFAINALCDPPGMVDATLSLPLKSLTGITYAYRVNNGPEINVDPIGPQTITLDQGPHLVEYLVTDCGGNRDSCSYMVTVLDKEPPMVQCPADVTIVLPTDSCAIDYPLPLPLSATDNCEVYGSYDQIAPLPDSLQWITFANDPNLGTFQAEAKTITFNGVAANAVGSVSLRLMLRGDFSSNGAFVNILGEDGALLGTSPIGVADCNLGGQLIITISAGIFNNWATDGSVSFQVVPNDISVPPGVPGDGVNPCDNAMIQNDGDADQSTYIRMNLRYNSLSPSFFTEGALQTPTTPMTPPEVTSTLVLPVGATEIFYIVPDIAGNVDTCSHTVTVEDQQAPVANCAPTTLFISPTGLQVESVSPMLIDDGSTDNCMIDTMLLSPSTFTCDDAGINVPVSLTVVDQMGNQDVCTTFVRIESELPMPVANSGLCGGDTLFLIANPPPAPPGISFTYRWYRDDILIATIENPTIPNIDANDAGVYRVEIEGLTGCIAENVVIVDIEDLPLTPEISTPLSICTVDDIVLTSTVVPAGSGVVYRWYEGVPGSGSEVLLGSTLLPEFVIPGPQAIGNRFFHLTIEAQGCISQASPVVNIEIFDIPTASVAFSDTVICGGSTINLAANLTGSNISFDWSGPDGFTATNQFPSLGPVTPINSGSYVLRTLRNGCYSLPDTIQVIVLPQPEAPSIGNNSPICEGEELRFTTTATGATTYHWIDVNQDNEFVTTLPEYRILDAGTAESGPWRLYVRTNGCASDTSAITTAIVNPRPVASASANSSSICERSELILQANPVLPGATYEWTGPASFGASIANPIRDNMTPDEAGSYQVIVTSQESCADTASIDIGVIESVDILAVTNNAPACLNGEFPVNLFASVAPSDPGDYTYEWRNDANQLIGVTQVASIANATAAMHNGLYSVIVFTPEGCPSEPGFTEINANDKPETPMPPQLAGDTPGPFCTGDLVRLEGSTYDGQNVTYFWLSPASGTQNTPAPILTINDADNNDTGDYSYFVIVDGCASEPSGPFNVVVNEPPVISAFSNSPVCAEEVLELEASFLAGATYNWNGPMAFTSSVFNPVIPMADTSLNGTYRVVATLNNCVSDTVSIQVTIAEKPAPPIILPLDSLCISNNGTVLELRIDTNSVVAGDLFTWYDNEQQVLGPATTDLVFPVTDFSEYTEDGSYPFQVQVQRGDCISDLSTARNAVFNLIPPNMAFAGDDTLVCANMAFNLLGESPTTGTGFWTLEAGDSTGILIANPDDANTVIDGLVGNQNYTFRWTLSNGACQNYSFDEVTLTASLGEAAIVGDDIHACADELINLMATPVLDTSATAVWKQSLTQVQFGVTIDDPTDPNTLVAGLNPDNVYIFTWEVVSGCGIMSDQIRVTISDPAPNGGPDRIVCVDDPEFVLSADRPTLTSQGAWRSLSSEVSLSTINDTASLASNLQPGENIFIWEIDEGLCGDLSRDTVRLFYQLRPFANDDNYIVPFGTEIVADILTNDENVPPGALIAIVSQPTKGTAVVNDDGTISYTSPPNFVGSDELVYEIMTDGCEQSTARVVFQIGGDAQCQPPNIFTPNNDGVNDAFVIPCLLDGMAYPNSEVTIFNRWGDEVFLSGQPYQNNWTGTFDGEDLPSGTYFYLVNLGDGSEPMTGFVMIQR